MSSPYPPQPPKRLERSKSNRILGGVCAGVANYLNMDPTLVRVLTVVISLFTGVPVILYIIALFVVPEEGSQPASPAYPPVGGPQGQAAGFPYGTATDGPAGVHPIGDIRADLSRFSSHRLHLPRLRTLSGVARARHGSSVRPPRNRPWSPSQNPRVPQSLRRRSLLQPTRRTPPSRHRNLRGPRSGPQ